ncbi:hypothetical protein FACS189487_00780 [Campylobacterota bacterium]|nr:hypothetical protein FACS189487_00780 [Campylobacterota bacterium]
MPKLDLSYTVKFVKLSSAIRQLRDKRSGFLESISNIEASVKNCDKDIIRLTVELDDLVSKMEQSIKNV